MDHEQEKVVSGENLCFILFVVLNVNKRIR